MPGYAHIIRLGLSEGTYGRIVGEYQFTYNLGGNSWVRAFDNDASLAEFLRSDVGLQAEAAEKTIEDLRETGKATIADLEIPEADAPALGMEQLPSDY